MPGTVVALGTAPAAGAPIESQSMLRIATAHGAIGDRYALDQGFFKGHPDMEITLVEAEDAAAVGVEPLALRRNIVTRGIDLETLIGRTFRIGDTTLHGMRPCLPCGYLANLLERPGLDAKLRGGLRARVVHPGAVRLGDTLEPVPVTLTADMRAVVESAHLAFVATVGPDARPNLSPKGTIRVLDDHRLFFLEIASQQTRRHIVTNPWMEINVVDTTSRRGWRFLGKAKLHKDDEVHAAAARRIFEEEGTEYPNRGAIVLDVERALPLVSPGYAHLDDEHAMRAAWKPRRAELDATFEEHLAKTGPFRLP